jgi:hypothetical protein
MLTIEENPESYHSQMHTALALLLLAKNNNWPQQIWRLRLLQLQQQWLLSDLTHHQPQPQPLHRLPPQLHNELREIYKPQCGEPLEAPEDLKVLGTLEGLAGLEALVDLGDPEDMGDLLLLQPPQSPQQQHWQGMQMTDLWGAYPNPLKEIGSSHEVSLTN